MATRNQRRSGVKPRPAAASSPAPATTEEGPGVTTSTTTAADEQPTLDPNNLPDPADDPVADAVVDDPDEIIAPTPDPEDATDDEPEKAKFADLDETPFRKYWQSYLDESGVVPPEGRILFPGEPLTFEGHLVRGDIVTLSEDVYRMVVAFRSITPTFVLEARKGTEVPKVRVVTKSDYRAAVGDLFESHTLEG